MSAVQTLDIRGRKFVLIPESEYRRLTRRPVAAIPRMPAMSPDGTYPAAEAMRAMMARKIIAARKSVGLSQAALARNAGIRVETLNRLERGKHTPDLATMARMNKALDEAGAPQ
ncbi:MAG: helix-turn-helix transcriptional regulator [Tepidisphaeraceae bacterium]|jgi:DNA-binding XRE family transcriptional regulator